MCLFLLRPVTPAHPPTSPESSAPEHRLHHGVPLDHQHGAWLSRNICRRPSHSGRGWQVHRARWVDNTAAYYFWVVAQPRGEGPLQKLQPEANVNLRPHSVNLGSGGREAGNETPVTRRFAEKTVCDTKMAAGFRPSGSWPLAQFPFRRGAAASGEQTPGETPRVGGTLASQALGEQPLDG